MFEMSYAVLWAIVLFETLVLVLVFRELGLIYMARREAFERDGPELGAPIPNIEAVAFKGGRRGVEDLPGSMTALVFGAFGCQLCAPAVHTIERWTAWIPGLRAVLLAERRDLRTLPRDMASLSSEVWIVGKGEIKRKFGVRASPYVVIVDERGTAIAKGLVNHHGDVNRLLSEARDRSPRLFAAETEPVAATRGRLVEV